VQIVRRVQHLKEKFLVFNSFNADKGREFGNCNTRSEEYTWESLR